MTLALSEGSWLTIALFVVSGLGTGIACFLRYKQKADNADTMEAVDEKLKAQKEETESKIHEELEPVKKSIRHHEKDFKDFQENEFKPLKENYNSLDKKTSNMDIKIDNILEGIGDIKKLFEKSENKSDKQFENVWKVLQNKQDKK